MPTFAADRLEQLITAIFERAVAPTDHASCVAAHLVNANLAGHDSHGTIRVPQYIDLIDAGRIKPAATMEIVTRLPAAAVVDGRGGFGQVIVRDAMRLAIELAKQSAIGAVTVRNCSHTGRIGTYTQMAAEAGLVGIATVNSGGAGHAVAPFGGTAARLSTNPISIAAPTDGPFPIVLDMATSVAPEGKVRTYLQADKPLPSGWIVDAEGKPSFNAADFYAGGAILPLGGPAGHKGFGLGFMVDILAGALSGGGCCARPAALERQYAGNRHRRAAVRAARRFPAPRGHVGRARQELSEGSRARAHLRAGRDRSRAAHSAARRRHSNRAHSVEDDDSDL